MTVIQHHPSDLTLAEFAGGMLDEGRALVVGTHLAACASCREAARGFEHIRGAILQQSEPAPMAPDALQQALQAVAAIGERQVSHHFSAGAAASPLSYYQLGAWRRIGPRVCWRDVERASDGTTRTFMLKAAPGTKIPSHEHIGLEWTCVLQGAFRHQLGRFGPGDFDEADETVDHDPIVEEGEDCICLVALQGSIRFKGWFGRLIQTFVRL
jgi:putative transcriptional regulator